MTMSGKRVKIVAGLLATFALIGGIAYYGLTSRDSIVHFVPERDTKAMLKIFYDDWYWLFPGPDYSPEYILKYRSPGQESGYHRYMGKLQIKVLRDGGKLAGFTTYYKKNFYEGQVQFVAVSPDFRRKGYGRLLTDYAVKGLFGMGCRKVSLLTRLNNKGARRLYEKIGFKEAWRDEDGFIYYSIVPSNFKPKT